MCKTADSDNLPQAAWSLNVTVAKVAENNILIRKFISYPSYYDTLNRSLVK